MTDADLQPFVRELLEKAIEDRGLDQSVAEALLADAKMLEGQELREAVVAKLRGA